MGSLFQYSREVTGPHAGQVSQDKDVIFHYTTVACTLSPKPRISSCCADLPGNWALYAISVRRLIALLQVSFRRFLAKSPSESALT